MTAAVRHFRSFVHSHDDIPAFHAAYLVSTFLAAAILHLGYFVILIIFHMCLDYVKYRDYHKFSIPFTLKAIVLESISDIALVFISLTFAVYLSHDFMLATVSGLLRSQLTLLRACGTIIPKIRIMEHILALAADVHSYMNTVPDLHKPLPRMQRMSLLIIGICSVLLAFSFVLYAGHMDKLYFVVMREMSLSL